MASTVPEIKQVGKKLKPYVVKEDKQSYRLVLPKPLYKALQDLASRRYTTVLDLIKRCIRLGLIVDEIEQEPGAQLIVRRPGKPDEIIRLV